MAGRDDRITNQKKGRWNLYNSLGRRGGSNRPADTRDRLGSTGRRDRQARDFLRRHECESAEAALQTGRERTEFARVLFERAADPRNLRCAIDHLASEGGGAPGPDGQTIDDLDHHERWELARALGASVRSGRYQPGPSRAVTIPKGPGRGTRTLQIRNIQDRVVDRAILQVVQPFLDPGFSAGSFGGRPGRGREDALALAGAIAEQTGRWCLVLDDVKDAFDNVPRERLIDVVRKRLGTEAMVDLVGVVVGGRDGRGIPQGSSLSPFLLNLYLDHVLDRPWARKRPTNPLIRVVDDLLVQAADGHEAEEAHREIRAQIRAAGMATKAGPELAVRDLQQGATGDWLGYRLRQGPSGLEALPTERSWFQLEETLRMAHTRPNGPVRARESVAGWAEQLGPSRPYLDRDEFCERVNAVVCRHAFDEFPVRLLVEERLLRGYRQWVARKEDARRLISTDQFTAAPPARVC